MKTMILCLVGPSGSGKTYMSKFLSENHNIPYLVSLTTRPIREGEVNGVDHWFITPERMEEIKQSNDMLAYTKFGDYEYCALHSDVEKFDMCTYVVDEDGLIMLREKFKDRYYIVAIYIDMDEKNRLAHGVSQERIDRDKKRKLLPPEEYHLILQNNGTLEEFETAIINIA